MNKSGCHFSSCDIDAVLDFFSVLRNLSSFLYFVSGASRGIPGDADCVLKILRGGTKNDAEGFFFHPESINTCRKQRNAKQCACNSASI